MWWWDESAGVESGRGARIRTSVWVRSGLERCGRGREAGGWWARRRGGKRAGGTALCWGRPGKSRGSRREGGGGGRGGAGAGSRSLVRRATTTPTEQRRRWQESSHEAPQTSRAQMRRCVDGPWLRTRADGARRLCPPPFQRWRGSTVAGLERHQSPSESKRLLLLLCCCCPAGRPSLAVGPALSQP